MDPNAIARDELPETLLDLHNVEARLAMLRPGTRDHTPLAEVLARLRGAADQALRRQMRRTAFRDAAALSGCRGEAYRSTYDGLDGRGYLDFLSAYVSALGGGLEAGAAGIDAVFSGHRISIGLAQNGRPARRLNVGLRLALDGAEARSHLDRGRGGTGDELGRVLERYPGDVAED